jgi:hypothetical protein
VITQLTSHQAATEAIKELKGRLEEAERDAARYRWLRHGDNDETVMLTYDSATRKARRFDPRRDSSWLLRSEELDAAIDRALSLEGGGET